MVRRSQLVIAAVTAVSVSTVYGVDFTFSRYEAEGCFQTACRANAFSCGSDCISTLGYLGSHSNMTCSVALSTVETVEPTCTTSAPVPVDMPADLLQCLACCTTYGTRSECDGRTTPPTKSMYFAFDGSQPGNLVDGCISQLHFDAVVPPGQTFPRLPCEVKTVSPSSVLVTRNRAPSTPNEFTLPSAPGRHAAKVTFLSRPSFLRMRVRAEIASEPSGKNRGPGVGRIELRTANSSSILTLEFAYDTESDERERVFLVVGGTPVSPYRQNSSSSDRGLFWEPGVWYDVGVELDWRDGTAGVSVLQADEYDRVVAGAAVNVSSAMFAGIPFRTTFDVESVSTVAGIDSASIAVKNISANGATASTATTSDQWSERHERKADVCVGEPIFAAREVSTACSGLPVGAQCKVTCKDGFVRASEATTCVQPTDSRETGWTSVLCRLENPRFKEMALVAMRLNRTVINAIVIQAHEKSDAAAGTDKEVEVYYSKDLLVPMYPNVSKPHRPTLDDGSLGSDFLASETRTQNVSVQEWLESRVSAVLGYSFQFEVQAVDPVTGKDPCPTELFPTNDRFLGERICLYLPLQVTTDEGSNIGAPNDQEQQANSRFARQPPEIIQDLIARALSGDLPEIDGAHTGPGVREAKPGPRYQNRGLVQVPTENLCYMTEYSPDELRLLHREDPFCESSPLSCGQVRLNCELGVIHSITSAEFRVHRAKSCDSADKGLPDQDAEDCSFESRFPAATALIAPGTVAQFTFATGVKEALKHECINEKTCYFPIDPALFGVLGSYMECPTHADTVTTLWVEAQCVQEVTFAALVGGVIGVLFLFLVTMLVIKHRWPTSRISDLVSITLLLAGLYTDIQFIRSLDPTISDTRYVQHFLSLGFVLFEVVINFIVITVFFYRQTRHERFLSWWKRHWIFRVVLFLLGLINIDALVVLDSQNFGLDIFNAQLHNHQATSHTLQWWGAIGVVLQDVPQLAIAFWVLYDQTVTTGDGMQEDAVIKLIFGICSLIIGLTMKAYIHKLFCFYKAPDDPMLELNRAISSAADELKLELARGAGYVKEKVEDAAEYVIEKVGGKEAGQSSDSDSDSTSEVPDPKADVEQPDEGSVAGVDLQSMEPSDVSSSESAPRERGESRVPLTGPMVSMSASVSRE